MHSHRLPRGCKDSLERSYLEIILRNMLYMTWPEKSPFGQVFNSIAMMYKGIVPNARELNIVVLTWSVHHRRYCHYNLMNVYSTLTELKAQALEASYQALREHHQITDV